MKITRRQLRQIIHEAIDIELKNGRTIDLKSIFVLQRKQTKIGNIAKRKARCFKVTILMPTALFFLNRLPIKK